MSEKSIGKSPSSQNKTFIRGESPGESYELLDKEGIGGRRWDIPYYERKVGDMKIDTVTPGRARQGLKQI